MINTPIIAKIRMIVLTAEVDSSLIFLGTIISGLQSTVTKLSSTYPYLQAHCSYGSLVFSVPKHEVHNFSLTAHVKHLSLHFAQSVYLFSKYPVLHKHRIEEFLEFYVPTHV